MPLQKSSLIIGIALAGLAAGGAVGYYVGFDRGMKSAETTAAERASGNPYAEVETNPLGEVKTNPYSDVKVNPFE